ncbi:MAG: hypothetical protein GY771_15810 [bacterium]|nr:hypothetical protein [bacterium]
MKRKHRIWTKLALAVNASLFMVLGFVGSNDEAAAAEPLVPCYMPIFSDQTDIDTKFETSDDWYNLETNLYGMESLISSGRFDHEIADKLYNNMKDYIANMEDKGLINEDAAAVLRTYVGNRHMHYCTNIGGVLCYDMAAIPPGKETTKKEIVETTATLRQLYEDGKIDGDAYDTALATLEEKLELYTEKEDNAVLRQLLLDLADGTSGSYYK